MTRIVGLCFVVLVGGTTTCTNTLTIATLLNWRAMAMTKPNPKPQKYTERKVVGDIARILTGRESYIVRKVVSGD